MEALMEGEDMDGMEDDPMEEEKAAPTTSSGKQKVTQELRDKVQEVLKQKDYGSQRSAKLTQDDFLLLLSLFNQAGFHFA
jgi:18S rRNA (adenine1779-N6/adenine1780-N6)-dimethyltransferase